MPVATSDSSVVLTILNVFVPEERPSDIFAIVSPALGIGVGVAVG